MIEIWYAGVIWVVTHLCISSTPLRQKIVAVIGEGGYLALYSILAVASLGYLIWVYGDVPRFDYLWLPNPDLYWVAKYSMPVALIFLVGGFMVKNPTNVGASIADDELADPINLARGVTRITRHPFQWSVVIWAAGHIVANGDLVSIIFFTSIGLVSLVGTVLIDIKKARTLDDAWKAYAAVTSNVPFVAVLTGRNRIMLRELALPVVVGLVLYALTYYFHETISGSVII